MSMTRIWSLFPASRLAGKIFAALVVILVTCTSAYANSTYGAPYYLVGAYAGSGGFATVDAAVAFTASKMLGTCDPKCVTLYYYYYDNNAKDSAVSANVTDQPNTVGNSVWATEYNSQNIEQNLGGCSAADGGKGGLLGGSSPIRSFGDAANESGLMCPGKNFVGDPINASNGNKYQQDTDFRDNDALTFRRFYNSAFYANGTAVVSTSIGAQWRHSFDRSLIIHAATGVNNAPLTSVAAYRPDGSVVHFTKSSTGWTSVVDTVDVISEQDDASGAPVSYTLFTGGPRETETYSPSGALLSITDRTGAVTTLTYSIGSTSSQIAPHAGLLLTVTDPAGRALSFIYDSSGRVATLTLPDGGALHYAYDARGNLASVTYPDSHSRNYVYNESALNGGTSRAGALTGLVDEKGVRFETTSYDSTGRAISAGFAGNVDTYQVTYGQLRNTATTPLGQATALGFQSYQAQSHVTSSSVACGDDCAQPYQTIAYDTHGWPTSFIDFNNHVTTTVSTASGLETQRIEGKNSTAQRTIVTTWDTALRNPLTRSVANTAGTVVAQSGWAYNTRGQVTADCSMDPTIADASAYICSASGVAPAGVRRSVSAYCDAVDGTQCPRIGLLLSNDGPRTDVNDVTRYSYYLTADESGCGVVGGACHRAGDLYQLTDASGHAVTFMAYDKAGRTVRRKDANGVITDLTYTPRGWLASRTVRGSASGVPAASDAVTKFAYEATGALHSVTDPDGVTLTYTYDDAHRLVDVADAKGGHIHYTLDASGHRTKEETFDAANTSRRSLSRTYNALGQLITQTDGLGKVTFDASVAGNYDGAGNLIQAKDPLGVVQKNTYDALNRVVARIANATGTDAATKSTTTGATFDALDRVTAVTDPDGLVTSYGFDGLSNPISLKSPDTGLASASFDAAGNAVTRTDAKGVVSTNGYDALGRLISTVYSNAQLNVAYDYDEANSVTGCASSFPVGHLTRMVEVAVTTSYCYDNQGRVTEQRQTQGTVTDVTDYVYSAAGRLAAMVTPSGTVTEYGRDTLGQITSVKVTPIKGTAVTVVTSATYLPFGPVSTYTLGNGQVVVRGYDANYAVTDVTSPALNLHFARDAAGNITALGDTAGASPASETYGYDPLYRLTSVNDATGKAIEAYTYNKTGDRLSKSAPGLATGTYGYQTGTHWLTSIGAASRTYDANGSTTANATAGVAWGYGYDGRGRLTVVQQGGATVAIYTYSAMGQRIAKVVGATSERFMYGSNSQLLGEYGSTSRDYIWMGGLPVGIVDVGSTTATVAFVHADALGTPRAVTNDAGASIWSWPFKSNPFGEQVPVSASGYVLNLRFLGQYYDVESGLRYNVNRDFDASTGRYVQSDPFGLSGGSSTYGYALSNPLTWTDPLGLSVYLYARPTQITGTFSFVNNLGITHQWIKTDRYEAGMGPLGGGVPGQGEPPDALFSAVGTINHSGQSNASGSYAIPLSEDVDEGCVDEMIQPGRSLGAFVPEVNDCHTFVQQVIKHCAVHKTFRTMPQI